MCVSWGFMNLERLEERTGVGDTVGASIASLLLVCMIGCLGRINKKCPAEKNVLPFLSEYTFTGADRWIVLLLDRTRLAVFSIFSILS